MSGTTWVGPAPTDERAYFHELATLTTDALREVLAKPLRKIAVLPVGATEAHGPHLPLGTDSWISDEVARRSAHELARRGMEAVFFPTLHYAVTDWAAGFAGTVSISKEAVAGVVLGVARSAMTMGFDRVALVTAHLDPDHIAVLRRVAIAFEADTRVPLVFADTTRRRAAERLTEEFRSGSCHAGRYETSLMLAIRPELVDRAIASALPPKHVPLADAIRDGARSFVEVGMDQAYCGDPAAATEAEGHATLDALAAITAEAVAASFGGGPS